MFDWLTDVSTFCDKISGTECLSLTAQGATETELSTVEAQLGTVLPSSYRSFLSRWNGAKYKSSTILSTKELVEMADFAGFKPFSGDIDEKIHDDIHAYYMHKPAYHLAFRTFELGSDVYCFDTRDQTGQEYPVCRYDVDFEMDYHLTPRFPSFEAMLLLDIYTLLSEDVYDMIEESDMEFTEECIEEADVWASKLANQLLQRGAQSIDSIHPDWSQWQ